MVKPTLALTGASGFLGRHLAQVLSEDYRVRAISTHPIHFASVSEVRAGNIQDPIFLQLALKGCTVLVHCAAITNTVDPDLVEINVDYTQRLVTAAKKMRVKQLVYISTENVTYHCRDPYTKSKAEAEKGVQRAFPDALILRPSLVFGKEDKRYLAIFAKAIRRFPIVPVFSKRACTLQPIHVEDVAHFILQGLRLKKKGIFTLVGAEPLSFAELGKFLARFRGKNRWFIPIPTFLIKLLSFGLQFGPSKAKRLHFMLKNAFVVRSTSVKKLEQEFKYTLPPFEKRLRDIIYK